MTPTPGNGAWHGNVISAELGFARTALARFNEERGFVIAASLSYTSLLALVPLVLNWGWATRAWRLPIAMSW